MKRQLRVTRETIRQLGAMELERAAGGERNESFIYSCVVDCTSGFPSTSGQSSMPQVCPMRGEGGE
jgi:hypothetical protein